MAPSTVLPDMFTRAVDRLLAVTPRPEIIIEEVPAPRRLAPYAHALGGTINRHGEEVATGRFVLLYDPAGHEAWSGIMRLVGYVTATLEPELVNDPLLAGVCWSWLIDALDVHGASYTAVGGTVSQVTSTRFGDLAGPPGSADLELRASWTPLDADLGIHLSAWLALLASAAGLPPPGVTSLSR
jgi:hypothetical protein